jgi:STE24 endopeptidase
MSSDVDTPEAVPEEMTSEQLTEAKRYGNLRLGFELADKLLDVGLLAIIAVMFARSLDLALQQQIAGSVPRLVVLFLIVTGIHICLSYPLDWYGGFVLEQQFQMSRQSYLGWLLRYLKRTVLMTLFGLVMVVGLYGIIWITGPWWWLVAAIAFLLLSVVLGQLAPVLILPLFYKIQRLDAATPEPDPRAVDLLGRLTQLASGTGLAISGVYRLVLSDETNKANAMLAGIGRTRRVLLGDTLLDGFSPPEIDVVFAHEIGHHVFRHIPKMIVVGGLYSLLGFWMCDRVLAYWIGPGYDPHQLPPAALPVLMLVLTLFSIVLEPLQNILSRRFERQCDRFALERTRDKGAYLSAFRKLARLNKSDPAPNPVAVFLFHSHPPIAERLAAAEK